jgi:hypothetical protein
LKINNNKAKVLLINAQNHQQTLSKNTRIGTLSREATVTIYTTTQNQTESQTFSNKNHQSSSRNFGTLKTRAVSYTKDNSRQTSKNNYCYQCKE